MSEQRSDGIERIEKVMEPVVTAEAESAGPDRQPKEFRLYLSDTEACLRIRVPYEGVVTHTTQNRGDKFVGSNKGYLRRSRDELSRQDVIEEFESRTGTGVADTEQTDIFGDPLPELTEEWQYVPCIQGNYSGRTGYDTRHEAIGQCAMLNRRNPDVEFSIVSVEVTTGAQ